MYQAGYKRLTSSRGGPEGLSGITISWPASSVFDFFFGLGGVSILSSSAKLKVPTGAVTVLDASVAAGSGVGSLGGSSSSLQEQSRVDQKQAEECENKI